MNAKPESQTRVIILSYQVRNLASPCDYWVRLGLGTNAKLWELSQSV